MIHAVLDSISTGVCTMPQQIEIALVGSGMDESDETIQLLEKDTRLKVASVYDSTHATAVSLAERFKGVPAKSLKSVFVNPHLRGVIVLNAGWLGAQPLFHACCEQVPVLFDHTARFRDDFAKEHLLSLSRRSGTLLMPSYLHRWTPSTLRMRELIATQTGAVESMSCSAINSDAHTVERLIDTSCAVMQSAPLSIAPDEDGTALTIRFRRLSAAGTAVVAKIVLPEVASLESTSGVDAPQISLTCRHGSVEMYDDQRLHWSHDGTTHTEELSSDRSACAVMLDLFGRRLVGGLVPVPGIEDLHRCHSIQQAALKARQQNREISLESASVEQN